MSKMIRLTALAAVLALLAGCSIANRTAGIPNRWQQERGTFKVQTTTEQDVLDHCRKYLTNYKRPRAVEFRDDLPKTNVGKILRRALREE